MLAPSNDDRLHVLALPRHPELVAVVRPTDWSVIFVPKGLEANDAPSLRATFRGCEAQLLQYQPRVHADHNRCFYVYLVVSEECNLACAYCDVLSGARGVPQHPSMTLDTARRVFDLIRSRLSANDALVVELVFFGGEPLLNWPIIAAVCTWIQNEQLGDRIKRTVFTNGTLLDPDRARQLRDFGVYVVVSLDGRREVNDRVRIDRSDRGSFDDAVRGIRCLQAALPQKFGISCTLGSHNACTIAQDIHFLHKQFRPASIGVNMYHFRSDGTSTIEVPDEEISHALLAAFCVAREHRIVIHQFQSCLRAFASRNGNEDYCAACRDKLLVRADGAVGRCEARLLDCRYQVSWEDFAQHGLPRKLDWSRQIPTHVFHCEECPARWICGGGCVHDVIARTGQVGMIERRRCMFYNALLVELLDNLADEAGYNELPEGIIVPRDVHFERVVAAARARNDGDTFD